MSDTAPCGEWPPAELPTPALPERIRQGIMGEG